MSTSINSLRRGADERVNWAHSIPFFLVHVLCFAFVFTGITTTALLLFVAMFFGRAFFVTAAAASSARASAQPLLADSLRVLGQGRRGGACCGGRRTTGPITATRTPTGISTHRARVLVEPCRLDLADKYKPTDYDGIRASPSSPSCGSSTGLTGSPWSFGGRFLIGVVRSRRRFLLVDGAALAQHIPRELRLTSSAAAATAPTTQPQLVAGRAAHRRRGLAQQPPCYQASARQNNTSGRSTTWYVLKR
jgi:hypothetical protein